MFFYIFFFWFLWTPFSGVFPAFLKPFSPSDISSNLSHIYFLHLSTETVKTHLDFFWPDNCVIELFYLDSNTLKNITNQYCLHRDIDSVLKKTFSPIGSITSPKGATTGSAAFLSNDWLSCTSSAQKTSCFFNKAGLYVITAQFRTRPSPVQEIYWVWVSNLKLSVQMNATWLTVTVYDVSFQSVPDAEIHVVDDASSKAILLTSARTNEQGQACFSLQDLQERALNPSLPPLVLYAYTPQGDVSFMHLDISDVSF